MLNKLTNTGKLYSVVTLAALISSTAYSQTQTHDATQLSCKYRGLIQGAPSFNTSPLRYNTIVTRVQPTVGTNQLEVRTPGTDTLFLTSDDRVAYLSGADYRQANIVNDTTLATLRATSPASASVDLAVIRSGPDKQWGTPDDTTTVVDSSPASGSFALYQPSEGIIVWIATAANGTRTAKYCSVSLSSSTKGACAPTKLYTLNLGSYSPQQYIDEPVGFQTTNSVGTFFHLGDSSGIQVGLAAVENGGQLTTIHPLSSAAPLDIVNSIFGGTVLFRDQMPGAAYRIANIGLLNSRTPIDLSTSNRVDELVASSVPGKYGISVVFHETGPAPAYTRSFKYLPGVLLSGVSPVTIVPPQHYELSAMGMGVSANHALIPMHPVPNAPNGTQSGLGYFTCD